jgi:hypothetical protein
VKNKTSFVQVIQTLILLGLSSTALAQDCSEAPVAPDLVDGATASMDQLVANSEEVKTFIAAADSYLDCRYAYRDTVAYKDLSRSDKGAYTDETEEVLDARNEIGDDFNDEVAAYQAANP